MKKIIPFVLIAFLLPPATPAFSQYADKPTTLEISATSRVESMPNRFTLSFAIDTDAPLAKIAVSENAARTEKVFAELRSIGGKESKIWTAGFSLAPLYEKGDPTKPSGFRARNTVFLESKALDKAGLFIDSAAEAGVSRIGNLEFTSDTEDKLRTEAAVKALRQATHDAEMLARTAGLSIRRIIRITYDQRGHTPVSILRDAALAGTHTPVAVGEISVNATVHVVFELE